MTAKLISFAELVKKFNEECCGDCDCCIHHLPDHSERNTHCVILNSLRAADAVPVVRCRQCKYYNRALRLCNNGLGARPFEFYCADGAKKDGGAEE